MIDGVKAGGGVAGGGCCAKSGSGTRTDPSGTLPDGYSFRDVRDLKRRLLANEIMTRINAATCVTPVNLIGLVLLAMPRRSMGVDDLTRQLELYASLLRQAPYSPRVSSRQLRGDFSRAVPRLANATRRPCGNTARPSETIWSLSVEI